MHLHSMDIVTILRAFGTEEWAIRLLRIAGRLDGFWANYGLTLHLALTTALRFVQPCKRSPPLSSAMHGSHSDILIADDIFRAHVDQFFHSAQLYFQPDPSSANPNNHSGDALQPPADHEGSFLGIEPNHAVARFHDLPQILERVS